MKSDIDLIQEMDIPFLIKHGWTVPGNLAYRRCLDYVAINKQSPSVELIEEILLRYKLEENAVQIELIKSALLDVIEIMNLLSNVVANQTLDLPATSLTP